MSWLNKDIKQDNTDKSDQSRNVTHEEHNSNAQNGSKKTDPLVIVLETGSPTGCIGDTCMKHRKVHQSIGSHKEIGE